MFTFLAALGGRCLRSLERLDPSRLVVLGYLSYVLLGWALLCLPLSRRGAPVPALDHLFTAVSAMSTTGLATVSTADTYSRFGQAVILLLVQAGGLGYMTLGSFVVLAWSGRLSPLRVRVSGLALALPAGFEVAPFLRLMVGFTVLVEAAGTLALYLWVFAPRGLPDAAWLAVFHSVSAFCTAGFALFNDSFESFRADAALNLVLIALSYLGAVGFIVVADAWRSLSRHEATLTLTSKIILAGTALVSVAGTALFGAFEPLLQTLPPGERWLAAWFQVVSAGTTVGFNTVPIGHLAAPAGFLLGLVMVVGAAPAGTGGGLKITTFTALWAELMAVLRRQDRPRFFGREIPESRRRTAVAGAFFYGLVLAAGSYALALTENAPFADLMFEAASALGTVGLSRGLTGTLTPEGKAVVIALMFVGRAGPLALALAFSRARPRAAATPPAEDLAL